MGDVRKPASEVCRLFLQIESGESVHCVDPGPEHGWQLLPSCPGVCHFCLGMFGQVFGLGVRLVPVAKP